jgi:CHAD domain-containing protein
MHTRRRRDPTTKTRNGRVTSRLLQRRARALERHLPAAVAGEDIGVHQARVATRRLREAVPVLAKGLKHSKAGKARRKIRRLTRALGTVRELDVTLQLISDLMQSGKLSRPALEEVRRHVIEERDRRRGVMLERLEAVDAEKLGRRLTSVVEALAASTDERWRQVLSARLLKRARRLKTAVAHAGHLYAPERLHDVRIAAKKLRYGVELAADGGVRSAAPLVARIKRVQDLLGRLHDMQILQTHIAAVQGGAGAERDGMHQGLEALATHVESECRHLHAKYSMSASAVKEVCETVLSRVVPDTARSRPRRPLKMPLSRQPVANAAGSRR